MSNIYIQEPPTSGKVLLTTTVGDIEIELWSKEAPLACRNFVQLCLEQYYDNTIFHRLVPGFVVQGGDPTGTGFSDESIYGVQFRDEFHSRLRFMRRGLVGTANGGQKNSNGSQFFFTLDATPDLQNKHTIFGKVVGNTLYNMMKLGESEVDANDRPVFVNKILKTEVLVNPFDDIVPRHVEEPTKQVQTESKSKATKNFGLLSFGLEAEEEEEETIAAAAEFRLPSKSSHDVSNDPSLSSQSVLTAEVPVDSRKAATVIESEVDQDALLRIQQHLKESAKTAKKDKSSGEPTGEKSVVGVKELREQALKLQKDLAKPKEIAPVATESGEKNAEDPAVAEYKHLMDQYEGRKRPPTKKGDTEREEKVLARLNAFRMKLQSTRSEAEAPVSAGQELVEGDDGDTGKDLSWLKHKLSFEEETRIARDANVKNAADWYDLHDPRNPITKRRHEKGEDSKKKKDRKE